MEYNRWKAIKAVDAEYKAGKISQKQHARKVASIRKAYAEYEAQWVANMKAQYAQNQQAMATSGGGSSSGVYTYQPPPQFEYVQGPAHHPGGGYTPQPQFEYVYAPAHHPGGGYTPEPQQTYVQNTPHLPSGGYTPPPPQQQYVYNNPAPQQGGVYTPAPQMQYKYRSEMTAAEQKAFDKSYGHKTYPIQTNPHDVLATNVAKERERNVQWIGETGQQVIEAGQEIVVDAYLTKGIGKAMTPKIAPTAEPKGIFSTLHDFFLGTTKDGVEKIIAPKTETSKKKQ